MLAPTVWLAAPIFFAIGLAMMFFGVLF